LFRTTASAWAQSTGMVFVPTTSSRVQATHQPLCLSMVRDNSAFDVPLSSVPGRAWPYMHTTSPHSCRAQLWRPHCQPGLGRKKEPSLCPCWGWRESSQDWVMAREKQTAGRMLGTRKMRKEDWRIFRAENNRLEGPSASM
jgi:hypothetical protein